MSSGDSGRGSRLPAPVTALRCAALPLLALALLFASPAAGGERFEARLSVVPVDLVTSLTTHGSGAVTAVLIGRRLYLAGSFKGMSSPATAAHLHRAPKGMRGPIAHELEVSEGPGRVLGGVVKLNDAQISILRRGELYVRIDSRTNPEGELRGWLLPADE